MTTIQLVLVLAAKEGWFVYQMDIKYAFLTKNLEEEVYVEQTPCFMILDFESKVCQLGKALYGLK